VLLFGPLALRLVDVLKEFVGEVSLVHGGQVVRGGYVFRPEDFIEDTRASKVVNVVR
jgi:hypothetical protein